MNRKESKQRRDLIRFNSLDKEAIRSYYASHTVLETTKQFHIGRPWLYKIVGEKRGYQTAKQLAKARGTLTTNPEKVKATKLARYGDPNYNNIDKHMQTRKLNSGSLENSYRQGHIKVTSTKMSRYGDPNYNNREQCKQTCIARYGVDNTMKIPSVQRESHKRYTYNGYYFDSSWELALWIYAKDHGEAIEQPNIRFEYTYNGHTYGYFPDFIYKGELVEIKGDHLKNGNIYDDSQNEKYLAKYMCAKAHDVHFMYFNDIKFALDYVYKTYGKAYMKTYKNRDK